MPITNRTELNISGLATPAALIVAWELAALLSGNRLETLPPPSQIGLAAGELARSGQMWIDFTHTLSSALIGWLLASAAGLGLGVALMQSTTLVL